MLYNMFLTFERVEETESVTIPTNRAICAPVQGHVMFCGSWTKSCGVTIQVKAKYFPVAVLFVFRPSFTKSNLAFFKNFDLGNFSVLTSLYYFFITLYLSLYYFLSKYRIISYRDS